jgi:hypothetical protein
MGILMEQSGLHIYLLLFIAAPLDALKECLHRMSDYADNMASFFVLKTVM